jgi:hypothetical protein
MVTAVEPNLIGKFGVKRCHFQPQNKRPGVLFPIFGDANVGAACRVHKRTGAIVMIEPFVTTRTFWPQAKPSAANHFPFSRMLGTENSFF